GTTIGALTANTWFRAVVQSGNCAEANSSSIAITVIPGGSWTGLTNTDWNIAANWCDGVPTASTNVIIPAGGNQPVISAGAVCNNLTINSGASLIISGSNTLNVNGNWTNNGGTFTPNASTVNFIGTAQTIGGTSSTTFNNFTCSTSGTKTITTAKCIVNGIFSMEGTATVSTVPTYGSSATLQYKGSAAQTTGPEFPATWTGSGGVIINNALGVTLSSSVSIASTLYLTSGILSTGANTFTVTNTSTGAIVGGSATNFVNGPLIRSLTAGQTYTFPVGKGSVYLPFGLTSLTGTAPQIRVEAFSGSTGGAPSSPLTSISTTEYWSALVISGTYTGSSVSLGRQTALNEFESIGRSSTLTGAYATLHGTVSGTSIINSDNTGSSLGYFVMASAKSITTGTISPTAYCQGSAVSVPYTVSGSFNSGNIFTAQLSNASGSFASPTNIGSLSSQTSGTINATIPAGQANGTGYRIRVVSSNPSVIGSDNGADLSIGPPSITGTFPGSRCGPGTVILGATASAGTINWYATLTGGSSLGTGTSFTTPIISSSTTYYVDATIGSCTSTPRTPVLAIVIAPPSITAGGGGTFCSGTDITLTSSGTNITNQYWTGPNNFYSLEQNPVLTNATSAMSGTYTVTASGVSGINLVTNGDFELGNTGFTSGYTYSSDLVPEGRYAVVADPHSVHPSFINCVDHTPTGTLQMVINGATVAGVTVWSETIAVATGTDYQFTYWIQSVVGNNPSQLQLYVNGIAAGPVYTALTPTCQWAQFLYNWNSGSTSTA
ncbi:MAG: hypothetical protein WCK09_21875, partial [Bacteroidota bacterium]